MKTKSLQLALVAYATTFGLTACGPKEDHDHDADGGHADHPDHPEGADHDAHDGHSDEHVAEEGHAHDDHDHGGGIVAGPNGGRVITDIEPHLELFVMDDRKVQISQLTEELTVVPIGNQIVSAVAGDRTAPTALKFAKVGDVLISDVGLPSGDMFPLVVSIKAAADSEVHREKINMNLADCPTCDNLEYACACDHSEDGEDGEDGHSHGDHDHDHDHDHGAE